MRISNVQREANFMPVVKSLLTDKEVKELAVWCSLNVLIN